jgi:uncharacterized protein YqeY
MAMKARDRVAMAVLRSTLAAIDNAEAVDRSAALDRQLAIERIPVGAGATEVERLALTQSQVKQIVRTELAERRAAMHAYDQTGRHEHASRLREEISTLARYLPDGLDHDADHDLRLEY